MHKDTALTTIILLFLYTLTGLVFYAALTREYVPLEAFSRFRFAVLLLFIPTLVKYLLHLFVAPWYPVVEKMRARRRPAKYLPSVSVLIPAWNEEIGIATTISSVLATQYPKLEVIVINDGSSDRTHDVVTDFIATYRRAHGRGAAVLEYLSIENGGKARALNRGLSIAHGDIVITIDSDSAMDIHAIHNLVKHFSDPTVASVAGNVVIGNRTKPIGFIQQLEYLYGFYFKRADSLLNAVYIIGGAAAAYRRSIVVKLGGFDETIITEDIELSTRLQDKGYRIRYAADALVYTEGPSDFVGLCRQRLRWKLGRLLTFYKYRHLFFSLDRRHSFFLSFLVLPTALFAEMLLFFEGILLSLFYVYTVYTNDYLPLAIVIVLLCGVVCLQILTGHYRHYHRNLFLLAPIAWLLFYFMDIVEYQALIRSIRRLITREKLSWQKWVRTGIFLNTLR